MSETVITFKAKEQAVVAEVAVGLLPLTKEELQQQLQQAGYGRCKLVPEQIKNLLAHYEQDQQKVKEKLVAAGAKILSYTVAEKVPAELSFAVAEDKMSASAHITAAYGGEPISANALVKAAQKEGIVFGFIKNNIIQLVSQASKADPGAKLKHVIAQGRGVQQGENSRFEALIPSMESRRNRPVVNRDDKKADLRDFGVIPSIAPGESLMRRHPPTLGKEGMTVTGEPLPAMPGLTIEWNLGEGVGLSADDADLLQATKDGLPRVIESGATVDDVFTVKQVDNSTGHIIFKGSVVVSGDVAESMKVIAGGNIFVKGFVEGLLLEAGGNVTIGGAVIGHQISNPNADSDYSTTIKAGGDVQCNMAQYARFYCGGNLYVNKQLVHSCADAHAIYAGPEEKPTGKVIGGSFYLDKGVYTGSLGALSTSSVLIKVNRLTDPIVEKQEVLRVSVTGLKTDLAAVKEKIEQFKKLDGSPAIEARLNELAEEFEENRRTASELIADIRQLEEQRKTVLAQAEVIARNELFSAVEVHFDKEIVRSRREYGPSKIHLVSGKAEIEPL
ncbi:FapA family protein [Alkalimonas collagenimarina]|uniref:FapA family protein n=1 Tax=Alkalimonas collagenimarina TaxID=400390 RepID=A0ABT9GU82_9GAMM|nr:FapA family protein [Alkalimonas collagenimarina]MDP4534613.1 FapA family protein [Alkalimonas collagenimarina]